ncbi:MAG: hypothetical protein H6734_14995 [Alphaproteobacteria bacterium]|nr:hypothetical protein [Alphaproteobacteria bacterium]
MILLALSSLLACAAEVRTIDGDLVTTGDHDVLVFWSVDTAQAPAVLRKAAALVSSGHRVLAVNTDSVAQRSRIRPYLRRHGVSLDVVVDPSGEVRREHGAPDDAVGLVGGQLAWTISELDAASTLGHRVTVLQP